MEAPGEKVRIYIYEPVPHNGGRACAYGNPAASAGAETVFTKRVPEEWFNKFAPSTPADAKGLLKQAIRDDNPCFFMEASGRGGEMGEVPEGDHTVPFGRAAVAREGRDVTTRPPGSKARGSTSR